MSGSSLKFFFDFISPNAFIAWTQIHALADRYEREVEPIPVLFAGLLNEHGLVGPAEVRAKWQWMLRDILRKAARLNIELRPPPTHPFNPLLALRLASIPMQPQATRNLIDALFAAVWAGGPGATDPAAVIAIVDAAGMDGAGLVAQAGTPEAKQRLRRQTDEALEQGVFGVPSMIVDGELFWGYDDFPHLEQVLAGNDPLDHRLLPDWSNIKPSATRRRP